MKSLDILKKITRYFELIGAKPYTNEYKTADSKSKLVDMLKYTTIDKKAYDASQYVVGYHTITIDGETYEGQRDSSNRFLNVPYDFINKNVLDIGCNQGGMLTHIQDKIKYGCGIDYNYKLINSANMVAKFNNFSNLSFYTFDLEVEDLNLINNFFDDEVDIVFLLSICMWIKNWKDVIQYSYDISPALLFETNGNKSQQDDQLNFLQSLYNSIQIISETSEDDKTQKNRSLVLCQR